MSVRNSIMHNEAQRRLQPSKAEWVPSAEPQVPIRVKLGLDAPTDVTDADVKAINRARKLFTP
jgi:hypothetical protein